MPIATSFADIIRDWEGLLAACRENPEIVESSLPQRILLEEVLFEVRTLKDRQDSFVAQRQRATQELRPAVERGREAARRLRAAAKANLGTNNELLVRFGAAPIRKRGGRTKPAVRPPEEPAPSQPTQT